MSALMLSWVCVPLSCSFIVSIRGDRPYISIVLEGIEVLLLRKSSCWFSLCVYMCVMLKALNFKGLDGQCSNDRKQISFHSRNHGVSREIVLKVVPQLHHFPCQQGCRKETEENRRECTTCSALTPFIPKVGGACIKSPVFCLWAKVKKTHRSFCFFCCQF